MVVDKHKYRAWNGTSRGIFSRVLAIVSCDLRYNIKRPAVIVIIAIIGLTTLFTSLFPILGSIFGGENMFIYDPNPHYPENIVPDVTLEAVTIYDDDGTVKDNINIDQNAFDISLGPGNTLEYAIRVMNSGKKTGDININLQQGSADETTSPWDLALTIPENILKVDQNDMEYNSFEWWIELDSKESHVITFSITLDENSKGGHITPRLTFTAWDDFEYDYWNAGDGYYYTSLVFNIRTLPTEGQEPVLGELVELEVVAMDDYIHQWDDLDLVELFSSPRTVKWEERLAFHVRITNLHEQPLWINCRMLSDYPQRSSIEFNGEMPVMVNPGEDQSLIIKVVAEPMTDNAPMRYYMQMSMSPNLVGRTRDYEFGVGELDPKEMRDLEGMFRLDELDENSTLLTLPLHVKSKILPVSDQTAQFFFESFYSGGINFWVILFGVIVGSGLIADDRGNQSISLFQSKAIPRYGYALGKFLGLFLFLFGVTALWSDIWFLAITLTGGFSWDFFVSHFWIIGALTLYGTIASVVTGSLVLVLSSLSKNRYYVGAAVISLFLMLGIIAEILTNALNSDYPPLISPTHNLVNVGHVMFDIKTPLIAWEYSALVLVGFTSLCLGTLYLQLVKKRGEM